MTNEFKKYMSDSPESFQAVLDAADDLIAAQYLLAESKISALLQKIAASSKAYELFEKALEGFDFSLTFDAALSRNALGVPTLTMPSDPKTAAAFAFCILLDIDTGRCALGDFLHAYFYRENATSEFALFLKNIAEPFKAAIVALSSGGEREEPSGEENSEKIKEIFTDVKAVSDKISATALDEHERGEADFAVGELSKALSDGSGDGIRLAYVALKNTVANTKGLKDLFPDVTEIGEKLVSLGVMTAA